MFFYVINNFTKGYFKFTYIVVYNTAHLVSPMWQILIMINLTPSCMDEERLPILSSLAVLQYFSWRQSDSLFSTESAHPMAERWHDVGKCWHNNPPSFYSPQIFSSVRRPSYARPYLMGKGDAVFVGGRV